LNAGPNGDPVKLESSLEQAIKRASDLLKDEKAPSITAAEPWAEAARKILRFQLARMLDRIPGVIAGEDPEEVHKMRVATRRQRAALRVFGDGLEPKARRKHRRELRGLADGLGAVRDQDVLLEILDAFGARSSARGRAGLRRLHDAWTSDRETSRDKLIKTLASKRLAEFVARYESFVSTEGRDAVPVAPLEPSHVRTRLPAAAWSAYQTVWAFDGGLGTADLATLHRLRIAGKWLRYTLEFAKDALEPDAARLIDPVTALQDHLGRQHDLHVAATLTREFVGSTSPASVEILATDRYVRDLDSGVKRLGRTLPRTWRPLASAAYRRRLGRALARL
jgi:CHAD domain-containing protein